MVSIDSAIRSAILRRGYCSLMLTGGNSAERLYNYWRDYPASAVRAEQVRFYFGDERCVPPIHSDSNYGMVMRTLFAISQPSGDRVFRMEAENPDRAAASARYEALLPERIDVLLLGLGTDGHIASLFPNSQALCSTQRAVLPVEECSAAHPRLSITRKVIDNAEAIFLLAPGEAKGRVLAKALRPPMEDFMSLPVRLAMRGTWLLDEAAARQLAELDSENAQHN